MPCMLTCLACPRIRHCHSFLFGVSMLHRYYDIMFGQLSSLIKKNEQITNLNVFRCLLASAPNVHTLSTYRILLCLGYTSINGSHRENWLDYGEKFYEGDFYRNVKKLTLFTKTHNEDTPDMSDIVMEEEAVSDDVTHEVAQP
ncbi:hypothetical protein CsSME_00021514 [Camellia sinensis var. sinensis]